jgi:ribosomal protein S18 acetylase RimI-like enzyme
VVVPVVYHDNFYKDVLEAGELAKLAFYNDIVVGAVCCRNDTSTSATGDSTRKLYIMTLGCLAPYRRLGIGSVMVEHVMDIVEKDGNYDSIFLHVQVSIIMKRRLCTNVPPRDTFDGISLVFRKYKRFRILGKQ